MTDLSKSIEQLENDYWNDTVFPTGLVERCTHYRKIPLRDLSPEQLRTLISQQIGLLYSIPVALQLLKQNPMLEGDFCEGDVLKSVLTVNSSFWPQHPSLKLEVQQILLNSIEPLSKHFQSIEFRRLSKNVDVHLPFMSTKELIAAIKEKHAVSGIDVHPPARDVEIKEWEKRAGFDLPDDFKEFYSICNGFECTDDIFIVTPLAKIDIFHETGEVSFEFAEYMIHSDIWCVRKGDNGRYEMLNDIVLTDSLQEFLERFLRGGVFEEDGLYDWQEKIKTQKK